MADGDRVVLVLGDSEQDLDKKLDGTDQKATIYKSLEGQITEWTGVFSARRASGRSVRPRPHPDPTVPKTTGLESRVAVLVKFVHHDIQELDLWYKEEHLKMLRVVPGWIRSWRYKLEDNAAVVLALHEYTSEESFQSAEIKAARSTEWRQRIMDTAELVEKRVLRLWKKQ